MFVIEAVTSLLLSNGLNKLIGMKVAKRLRSAPVLRRFCRLKDCVSRMIGALGAKAQLTGANPSAIAQRHSLPNTSAIENPIAKPGLSCCAGSAVWLRFSNAAHRGRAVFNHGCKLLARSETNELATLCARSNTPFSVRPFWMFHTYFTLSKSFTIASTSLAWRIMSCSDFISLS